MEKKTKSPSIEFVASNSKPLSSFLGLSHISPHLHLSSLTCSLRSVFLAAQKDDDHGNIYGMLSCAKPRGKHFPWIVSFNQYSGRGQVIELLSPI